MFPFFAAINFGSGKRQGRPYSKTLPRHPRAACASACFLTANGREATRIKRSIPSRNGLLHSRPFAVVKKRLRYVLFVPFVVAPESALSSGSVSLFLSKNQKCAAPTGLGVFLPLIPGALPRAVTCRPIGALPWLSFIISKNQIQPTPGNFARRSFRIRG